MGESGADTRVLQVDRNGVLHPRKIPARTAYTGPVRFGYVGGDNGSSMPAAGRPGRDDAPRLPPASGRLIFENSVTEVSTRRTWQYSGHIEIVPGYDYADIDECLRQHRRTPIPVAVAGELRTHRAVVAVLARGMGHRH